VRAFKIALNDSVWSSSKARAKGMRRVAVAQLGSVDIDETKFARILALEIVKQLLPATLRSVASKVPSCGAALEAAAVLCEDAKTLGAASSAASAAYSAADSAACSAACSAADSAACSAAYSAASAAYSAADSAAYSAARAACSAACSAARGAAGAADRVLSKAAEIAVQALIACGTQGSKWLDLTEQA
jgi:hypothetical protein